MPDEAESVVERVIHALLGLLCTQELPLWLQGAESLSKERVDEEADMGHFERIGSTTRLSDEAPRPGRTSHLKRGARALAPGWRRLNAPRRPAIGWVDPSHYDYNTFLLAHVPVPKSAAAGWSVHCLLCVFPFAETESLQATPAGPRHLLTCPLVTPSDPPSRQATQSGNQPRPARLAVIIMETQAVDWCIEEAAEHAEEQGQHEEEESVVGELKVMIPPGGGAAAVTLLRPLRKGENRVGALGVVKRAAPSALG